MCDGMRQMVCLDCMVEWTAFCFNESDELECPTCHTIVDISEVVEYFKKKGKD